MYYGDVVTKQGCSPPIPGSWSVRTMPSYSDCRLLGKVSMRGCLFTHIRTECDAHVCREVADIVGGVLGRRKR